MLKEDNLPIHLEAGPLARDPSDAGVLYAVYSLMPYSEVWRAAIEGGNLLATPRSHQPRRWHRLLSARSHRGRLVRTSLAALRAPPQSATA